MGLIILLIQPGPGWLCSSGNNPSESCQNPSGLLAGRDRGSANHAGILEVSTAVRSIDNAPQLRHVRRTIPPPAALLGPKR